jgi:hypothetical protein
MLEARECEPEMVQPVIERQARDRDAESGRVGEVGQSQPPGLVLLSEDDVLLGAFQRMLGFSSGYRRRSSASTPMERMPGAAFRIGTISPSQYDANGSGRRRSRGAAFCDGSLGSASMRYALAVENPALAAAASGESVCR